MPHKCWAFMISSWAEVPQRTLDKLERLENAGRLRYDEYTCEGTPEQCRANPDGTYYMMIGPKRDLPPNEFTYFDVVECDWDARPWGNLGSFAEEFPDNAPKRYRR